MTGGAARVGEEFALIADQPARRRIEHQPLTAAARGTHLDQLGFALRHLLHDDAGVLLVDVDDDLLDRLQSSRRCCRRSNSTFGRDTESSKPSRRMVSIRMPSCSSPRPATSMESLSSNSRTRSATLPSASRSSRSRMIAAGDLVAFGAGERRIVDAEGHRQRRRIDRLRRERRRLPRARRSCARRSPPAVRRWQRCRPLPRSSTAVRSRPRKARTLVTRPCSISRPS